MFIEIDEGKYITAINKKLIRFFFSLQIGWYHLLVLAKLSFFIRILQMINQNKENGLSIILRVIASNVKILVLIIIHIQLVSCNQFLCLQFINEWKMSFFSLSQLTQPICAALGHHQYIHFNEHWTLAIHPRVAEEGTVLTFPGTHIISYQYYILRSLLL